MSSALDVAVVVPFHYGGSYLRETVRSLADQSYPIWHAIIVIDGATEDEDDMIADLVADNDQLSSVRTSGSVGPAAARNLGASIAPAECDALLFLDCDDNLKHEGLSTLCAALGESANAEAAYGLSEYLGSHLAPHRPTDITSWARARMRPGPNGRLVPVVPEDPTDFAALAVANWISTPGQVLIRRPAFCEVDGFSEVVPRAIEDWDLWLRLATRAPLAFCDGVVVEWRQHAGSLSNDGAVMERKEDQYRRSLSRSGSLTPEQQQQVIVGRQAELRRRRDTKLEYAADEFRRLRLVAAVRELLRAAKLTWQLHRPIG